MGLKGSASITEQEGPGCECEGQTKVVSGTLNGKGGGECSVTTFGKSFDVGAGAEAQACVGRSFSDQCKAGDKWIKGVDFKLFIGPVKIGWIFTFEYEKKFQAGDDC